MNLPQDASNDQSNCPNSYYRRKDGMLHQIPSQPESPKSAPLSGALEIFCKMYATSGDASTAYKYSFGEEGTQKEIKALLGLPNVIERVHFLSNEHLELMSHSSEVNIDLLVRKLESARKLAMKNEEPAAATAAIMAMAKLHGLLVDKREMSLKRPEDMTIEELRQVLGDGFDDELASGSGLAIEHRPSDN